MKGIELMRNVAGRLLKSPAVYPPSQDTAMWFETLRGKWSEVPGGSIGRVRTADLLKLSSHDLLETFKAATQEATVGDGFSIRGWYHCLYKDIFRGKRVLDVGAGLGLDGIAFASAGAKVTFLDIVESNLQVIDRICKSLGISDASFFYMPNPASLSRLDQEFDVIWCQGSLINTPFEVTRVEVQGLLDHLKPNGRWVALAYPKSRWIREGRMPFEKWGEKTDGGAPWMEWYDLEKMLGVLHPASFNVVLYFEFHNSDFNWFDLLRIR